MSAVWVVRAGSYIEHQTYALKEGCAVIDWDVGGSLENLDTPEKIKEAYSAHGGSDESNAKVGNGAGQCYRFVHEINAGDYVVLPLRDEVFMEIEPGNRSGFWAAGVVKGSYKYDADAVRGAVHQREVTWNGKGIPDHYLPDAVSHALKQQMTVIKVEGDDVWSAVNDVIEKDLG